MKPHLTWMQMTERGSYPLSAVYDLLHKQDKTKKSILKYYLRAILYKNHFNKVLALFSKKSLSFIPDKHPEVLDKIFRPYVISGSSVTERTKVLHDCYMYLSNKNKNLFPILFEPEGLEIFRLCGGEYKVLLRSDGTFRKEGELSVSIVNASSNQRIYSCAFSFCEFENKYIQLIGAVQGPNKFETEAVESLRYITKGCFGVMPKNMVVIISLMVANLYGITTHFAIKSKSHVYQARRYYGLKRKAKVRFDYDALWREFNSFPLNDDLVEIKAYQKRNIDDVASKKRAMYKKRYELIDCINQSIMKHKLD